MPTGTRPLMVPFMLTEGTRLLMSEMSLTLAPRSAAVETTDAETGTSWSFSGRFSAVITISSSVVSGADTGAAADTFAALCCAWTIAPGPIAAINAGTQPRIRNALRQVTLNRYDMVMRSPSFLWLNVRAARGI